METLSALMMGAYTFERFLENIYSAFMFGAIPVTFLVFFVLFIIAVIKVKKKGERKVKAIVFGCISGYFLLGTIGEIVLFAMLASAIARM